MSKYTTELRFICEQFAGYSESQGYQNINKVISEAIPKVFDFDFPIFDESYRNVLCTKILKHYYTREICEETVGLWKFRLDAKLNEIMPYYNQLYKSELLNFNPLYDIDIKTTHDKKGNSNSSVTSSYTSDKLDNSKEDNTNKIIHSGEEETQENQTSVNKETTTDNGTLTGVATSELTASGTTDKTNKEITKYSDTPQGGLTNVEDGTYLTNATIKEGTENNTTTDKQTGESTSNQTTANTRVIDGNITDTKSINKTNDFSDSSTGSKTFNKSENITSNTNENTSVNTTEDYITKVCGKNSSTSYSKMLLEFRETFLNIDSMVINELSDLFFTLW